MTMPPAGEKGAAAAAVAGVNWTQVMIGAVVPVVLTGVMTMFVFQYERVSTKVDDQGGAIISLQAQEKADEKNQDDQNRRTEGALTEMGRSVSDAAKAIQSLKDGIDAQTKSNEGVEKRLADIDGVLRPIIHLPLGGR